MRSYFPLGCGGKYDISKIRFPALAPVDSKVRAKAEVVSVDEVGGMVAGGARFTLEVEGSENPVSWATASPP